MRQHGIKKTQKRRKEKNERMNRGVKINVAINETKVEFIKKTGNYWMNAMLWNRNRRNHNFLPSRNRNRNRNALRFRIKSGSGTGFRSGSNIKWNKKKSKKRGQLSGNNAASGMEKAGFCTNFLLLKNCAKNCLDTEPDPELDPEPELEPKFFQSRNR
jgi:hypothetical protein